MLLLFISYIRHRHRHAAHVSMCYVAKAQPLSTKDRAEMCSQCMGLRQPKVSMTLCQETCITKEESSDLNVLLRLPSAM